MKWIIMVRGEDGVEFRYSDTEYVSESAAVFDIKIAEADYPCAGVFVTKYMGCEYFERKHKQRMGEDAYDMY
jgi:hypothetical protein